MTTDDLLCRALKYAAGTHKLSDVYTGIAAGQFQLWRGQSSVIVTEITEYPRRRGCRIFLAAGDMDELVNRMEPDVVEWAKGQDCDHMEIIGRRGWRRVLNDYREPAAILTKEI